MSKSEELLKHLYFQFTDTSFAGKNYKEFKSRTLSNELVEEIENYLNRKDKLVVGSEWVCDVGVYTDKSLLLKGETVKIMDIRGDEVRLSNFYERHYLKIETILACFSPKEKSNDN